MRRKNYINPTMESTKKKKKWILIISILILMAIAFITFKSCTNTSLLKTPKETPIYLEEDGTSLDGEAKAASRDEILKELEKQQLVVTDKLSSNITFASGELGTVGEWIVENPEENTVIQQAEVYLNDILIAESTPIYPNQHITAIELLQEIASGEYEVIAYINYYDIETKEFISKAGYKIHLTVR